MNSWIAAPWRSAAIGVCLWACAYAVQRVSLDDVIDRVVAENSALAAAEYRVASAKASRHQAGALPNPELEVETENLGRSEIEVVVVQPLELGGKRRHRKRVAEVQMRAAELEKEAMELELKAEAVRRFVPVLALREKLRLLDSLESMATNAESVIRRRVVAGAAMAIDTIRIQLEIDELALERAELSAQHKVAKRILSALWGDSTASFEVCGELPGSIAVPDIGPLLDAMSFHPELRLLELQNAQAEAETAQAKAQAAPDMAVAGGYLRNNELEENAAILGVSVGLPLFDRNRGEVESRSSEAGAARSDAEHERAERKAKLFAAHSEAVSVAQRVEALETKLLPKAQQVYEAVSKHYERGLIGILDVIEAASELLELRMSLVETQEEAVQSLTDLYQLSGNVTLLQWHQDKE